MKFIHNDGGRQAAGFQGTCGDCVCRAVAIASQEPYQLVYDALAGGNATQRKGKRDVKTGQGVRTARSGIHTKRKWFEDYMHRLGFKWTACMQIGSGCTVHLKDGELPMGRLVVCVSKHYVAVIDGVINDLSDCSRNGTRCVYGYWSKA